MTFARLLFSSFSRQIISVLVFSSRLPVTHGIFSRINFDHQLGQDDRTIGPVVKIRSFVRSTTGTDIAEKGFDSSSHSCRVIRQTPSGRVSRPTGITVKQSGIASKEATTTGEFLPYLSLFTFAGATDSERGWRRLLNRGETTRRATGWRGAEAALTISIRARSLHDFLPPVAAACVASRRKVVAMKRKLMEITMVAMKTRRAARSCSFEFLRASQIRKIIEERFVLPGIFHIPRRM